MAYVIYAKSIPALKADQYFYMKSEYNIAHLENYIYQWMKTPGIDYILPLLMEKMNIRNENLKKGRYHWKQNLSLLDLLRKIRSGDQEPINLTISNKNSIEELAAHVAKFIEADSTTIINEIHSLNKVEGKHINSESILSYIIPNTYQFYWNCDAGCFKDRMINEYDQFWTEIKKKRLQNNGLTPNEAYILASIVEKESHKEKEHKKIAGVYINRLKKGMLLQADPTVVYASGIKGLRRVLLKHLNIDSPYNTYMYSGLPPGPICMPSLSSLDGVVHAENHNFLYFCAKPGYNSEHVFSRTLQEHNRNATAYRRWLNQEGL